MIESVSTVAYDVVAAAATGGTQAQAAQPAVYEVAAFEAVRDRVVSDAAATEGDAATRGGDSRALESVVRSLDGLNGRVDAIGDIAVGVNAEQGDLTPGSMLMLTVKAHEFMFHAELTANVANRSAEGVQQLFRQQG